MSDLTIEVLQKRLTEVKSKVKKAGGKKITIVAVTKTFDTEVVRIALEAGIHDLGENYAQELLAKSELMLDATPRWHFLGQLQRNKVPKLAPFVELWQTVDSVPLINAIARYAPGAEILLQVNLAGEAQRGGVSYGELDDLHEAAEEAGLNVRGLMGVAPIGEEDIARKAFRELTAEADKRGLKEVSAGMTADYELAVQEGSTMIRLGTALLGNRPAPI